MSNFARLAVGISLGALGGWLAAYVWPGSHWWLVPCGMIVGGLVVVSLSD